jgi:uncharacterized phage protein gp47/JayE
MAFQIKDFTSIVASMTNWMKATQQKVTDFNVGSVARTLVEAPAIEIDELYQQMLIGLKEAIPVSVYNSFDFVAITQLPATGLVRVSVTSSTSPITIPAGTTFSLVTSGVTFTSNNDVVIAAGSTYADVLVTCSAAGTIGNIAAGQSFTVEPAVNGLQSAQNLAAFINGVDTETDQDRKSRFNAFIAALPRGTVAAIKYGLQLAYLQDAAGNITERVASSSIVEPWVADNTQPIALVNCYIHNGSGATSGDLVNRARQVIYGYYDQNGIAVPGWKAAGVKVNIFAATETAIGVSGVITAAAGYDKPKLIAQAQQAVYTYILSLSIGAPVIVSEIIALVMGIEGVTNFALSAPSADVTADFQTKLMPGAIALT